MGKSLRMSLFLDNLKGQDKRMKSDGITPSDQNRGWTMPAKTKHYRDKYWYIEVNHQGESRKLTQWMNQKFDTEEMARFFEKAINDQIMTGLFKWDAWFPRLRQKYLFKEAYWKWLEHKPLAPSTYDNRRRSYQHFEFMANEDVRELRGMDFAWIREKFGDTPKSHALRSKAQAFLNWFHVAESTDKRIDLMPIKVPSHKTPYLDRETIWAIYDHMVDPYRDPMLLGIEMGMRIGEICALQWQDVDWEGEGINVCHTMSAYKLRDTRKGGDEVWLPMTDKVKGMLSSLKAKRAAIAGYVFTHLSGKQIWTQQLSSKFKHACREIGIPQSKFHHLRHSFLHDLSEAGASTREAQALAGHKSEKTTERYIGRWSKDKVREIANLRGGKT
jgi:integrase